MPSRSISGNGILLMQMSMDSHYLCLLSYLLRWSSAPCCSVEQLTLLEAGDAVSVGQGMARESFFLPVSGDQMNHLTRAVIRVTAASGSPEQDVSSAQQCL